MGSFIFDLVCAPGAPALQAIQRMKLKLEASSPCHPSVSIATRMIALSASALPSTVSPQGILLVRHRRRGSNEEASESRLGKLNGASASHHLHEQRCPAFAMTTRSSLRHFVARFPY